VLDGVERGLDPGEPGVPAGRLPRNLLEAAEALAADPLAAGVLGPELHRDLVAARVREWEEFHTPVSDWEVDRYLDAL